LTPLNLIAKERGKGHTFVTLNLASLLSPCMQQFKASIAADVIGLI
jgi:hypothetical protein